MRSKNRDIDAPPCVIRRIFFPGSAKLPPAADCYKLRSDPILGHNILCYE
jgi:hypothetical protein